MVFTATSKEKTIYIFTRMTPAFLLVIYLIEYYGWFFSILIFPIAIFFSRIRSDQIYRIEVKEREKIVELEKQGFILFGIPILGSIKKEIATIDLENHFFYEITGEYMETRYRLKLFRGDQEKIIISNSSMKSLTYAYNEIQKEYIDGFVNLLSDSITCGDNKVNFNLSEIDKKGIKIFGNYYPWEEIRNIELSGTVLPAIKLITTNNVETEWIGADVIPNYMLFIALLKLQSKKFDFILDQILKSVNRTT